MDFSRPRQKMKQLRATTRLLVLCCYRDIVFKSNSFFTYLFYLISLSCVCLGILKALKPRTDSSTLTNIDLFYTSVSTATVSSMSTLEMEVFSNAQLIVMTVIMFLSGEVLTSLARLHLNFTKKPTLESSPPHDVTLDQMESSVGEKSSNAFIEYDSIKFLGFVVLCYLLVMQVLGIVSVLVYFSLVSSAENVLRNKGIKTSTFAFFAVVSSFSSCGFLPTNESMIVFIKNSGLLLILIPQILLGNSLFPCGLRAMIWIIGRKFYREEAEYLLKKQRGGWLQTLALVATVLGFILIGFVLFSSMEWNTAGLDGLNSYRKVVAIIFQCVNSRHSGETVVDLSTISQAILVFFILMMYLPPYTSFLASANDDESKSEGKGRKRNSVLGNIVFSHISYLAIFVLLICITERKTIKEDPLNFSVMNITFEVISAYGNVGFSTGYSCHRQLIPDPKCVDKSYGFSGKWSNEGKLIMIVVMFMGRLKHFNIKGGQPGKLVYIH